MQMPFAPIVDSPIFVPDRASSTVGVGGLGGLRGHAVRLMKRRGRHGLGGSCDGQNKSNSDQPDHCHLHMNLPTHISTARAAQGDRPRTEAPGRAKSNDERRGFGYATDSVGCATDLTRPSNRRHSPIHGSLVALETSRRDCRGCRNTRKTRASAPPTGALTELRYTPMPSCSVRLDIHAQVPKQAVPSQIVAYEPLAEVRIRQQSSISFSTESSFSASGSVPWSARHGGLRKLRLWAARRQRRGSRARWRRRTSCRGRRQGAFDPSRSAAPAPALFLHPPDGVTVVVEEETDAAQQGDVLGPVVAPSTAAFHRF